MKVVAAMVLALFVALPAHAAEMTAKLSGSKATIRFVRHDGALLLDVVETARVFGWEAKVVTPGRLVTICRDGEGGVCIPIRLKKVKSHKQNKRLYVEATALAKALRFEIEDREDVVALRKIRKPAADDDDIPTYNADWGRGRGFRVGQTLPDIPLYDMQGREVRFSSYLGKQLVIYVWASW